MGRGGGMSRQTYRLPDDGMTTNVDKYVREWRALGEAVSSILGPDWRCVGFEPGLDLSHPRLPGIHVERRLALAVQQLVLTR